MSQNISAYLVQLLLALALAPLLPGIINRVKAKTAGRRGKPLLQTYYDLARLLLQGRGHQPHRHLDLRRRARRGAGRHALRSGPAALAARPRRWVSAGTFCWPPICWAWGASP